MKQKTATTQFEIIPHTSDVRLSVTSSSLKGIFRNALLGMNEILKKGFCKQANRYPNSFELKISSYDTTLLLIGFLSNILTLSHIHKTVFCHVDFFLLSEKDLVATISGLPVTKFDKDIKAVSYHEAEIVKNKQGNFQTNIIFDI